MPDWYRMQEGGGAAILIDAVDDDEREYRAREWNRKGFGIFWTVNDFNGARRIENLTRINAWAVDIDAGTKSEMRAKLNSSPVVPSKVVETKRGYQAYFNAKDAKPEHWNAILLDRLVPFFGADKNARDLARILRVPGFLHQKDPKDPYLVKEVHRHEVAYTEEQIANAFPAPRKAAEDRQKHAAAKRQHGGGDDFWERVWNLDCEDGLRRLSGVTGESYTFKGVRSGNRNIYVDGKGTSCWIDRNGRIGSLSGGGPTLYQWLTWFGTKPKDAVDILKRVFPHLVSK